MAAAAGLDASKKTVVIGVHLDTFSSRGGVSNHAALQSLLDTVIREVPADVRVVLSILASDEIPDDRLLFAVENLRKYLALWKDRVQCDYPEIETLEAFYGEDRVYPASVNGTVFNIHHNELFFDADWDSPEQSVFQAYEGGEIASSLLLSRKAISGEHAKSRLSVVTLFLKLCATFDLAGLLIVKSSLQASQMNRAKSRGAPVECVEAGRFDETFTEQVLDKINTLLNPIASSAVTGDADERIYATVAAPASDVPAAASGAASAAAAGATGTEMQPQ